MGNINSQNLKMENENNHKVKYYLTGDNNNIVIEITDNDSVTRNYRFSPNKNSWSLGTPSDFERDNTEISKETAIIAMEEKLDEINKTKGEITIDIQAIIEVGKKQIKEAEEREKRLKEYEKNNPE